MENIRLAMLVCRGVAPVDKDFEGIPLRSPKYSNKLKLFIPHVVQGSRYPSRVLYWATLSNWRSGYLPEHTKILSLSVWKNTATFTVGHQIFDVYIIHVYIYIHMYNYIFDI